MHFAPHRHTRGEYLKIGNRQDKSLMSPNQITKVKLPVETLEVALAQMNTHVCPIPIYFGGKT